MTEEFKAEPITTEEVLHKFLQSKIEWTKPEYTRAFHDWVAALERNAASEALTVAAEAVGSPLYKDDHKTTTLGEVKTWLLQRAEQYKKEETSD